MTGRLESLGEDGEWHEVPGLVSIELHAEVPDQTPAPVPQPLTLEQVAPFIVKWARHAVEEYARVAAEVIRQLNEAATAAEAFERARPTCPDRPAWQSPYGPPPRRR